MRIVSELLKTKLDSMILTKNDAPSCKVYRVYYNGSAWIEELIPSIISVNINKETEAFTQRADISIANINPTNPNDYGYYNPHRNDTLHNKPQNSWFQKLIPNTRIRIYMGYGTEIFPVFYGFIDSIEIDVSVNSCTLELICRDISKILTDRIVNSVTGGVKSWSIEYPIGVTTTSQYIPSGQGSTVDLSEVVKDVCIRAGFIESDIDVDPTSITIADTSNAYFEYEEVSWDYIINDIKSLTSHEFWISDDGKAHFKKVLNRDINITGVDFEFKNGKNIFQLPLTISHEDLYGQVLVRGDGVEYLHKMDPDYILWDGSRLWEDNVLFVTNEALLTEAACQKQAEDMSYLLLQKYVSTRFRCLAIPHLELYDVIQIIVWGSISEAYLITGINLTYQENQMDMQIKCYHYQYYSS